MKFVKKVDMLERKNWFSSTVVGDAIYLIGGYTRVPLKAACSQHVGLATVQCVSSTDRDMAGNFSIAKPA